MKYATIALEVAFEPIGDGRMTLWAEDRSDHLKGGIALCWSRKFTSAKSE